MITFMEWVVVTEAWTRAFAPLLAEGRKGAVDYDQYAEMFATFVLEAIEKGSYPDPLKKAGAELRAMLKDEFQDSEMSPATLGGKLRGKLSKVSPNDQEEIIMIAASKFWKVLPKVLGDWDKLNDDMISPDDLAGRISGSIQRYVKFAAQDHFRSMSRASYKHHGTPLSDIGDEDERPEASYDPSRSMVKKGLEITPRLWNDAIQVSTKVREKLVAYMKEAEKPKAMRSLTPGINPNKMTKLADKVQLMDTAISLMRQMPHQMSQQLDLKGGTSGDERIYQRLKSMILDDESDLDQEERGRMMGWATSDTEYGIRQPKQVVAASLWIAGGMIASQKPGILKGGNAKTFEEDNWFFQLVNAHDINTEDEVTDDEMMYRAPVAPVKKPKPVQVTSVPTSGSTSTPTSMPPPASKPPVGKPVQRGLFDDLD
jgi:hypothetical protein